MVNAPPADVHVVVAARVRDYGFSPAQQGEIWRRWREGQSFSLIGRALGAPMHHVRQFLYQGGGVRLTAADYRAQTTTRLTVWNEIAGLATMA